MGSFIRSPGGVGVMPYDALGDIDTGIAPWGAAAVSSTYTGFQHTGLGYIGTEFSLPELALTVDRPPDTVRGVAPFREMTEEETNKRGYILANDPALFKKMFPTVPHEEGMTIERATAIKEYQDSQLVRDFYMKDRPITSFVGQLAGSIPTPENFIPFLGQLGVGLKVGRATQLAISAGRASGEAVIGTAAVDLAAMPLKQRLGVDTSWEAMAMDIGFSALIGAGFGTVTGLFNTPSPTAITPDTAADSPEARARANVVMNDAIGSFLNSSDNTVRLGPQSYRYILETTASVPESNVTFTWDHVRAEDNAQIQAYATHQLLNDPAIASLLEGTQVVNNRGQPMVVYAGSMVPETRRIDPEMDMIGAGTVTNFENAQWFSTNPKHAEGFIESLGTHPDVQNIDYPIDPKTYRGPGTRAVKIGDEYFIGGVHREALEKAVAYYGADSQTIRDFENLPWEQQEQAFGHLDNEGYHPADTAISGKDEVTEYLIEARADAAAQKTPEGTSVYGIIKPRIEGALLDIKKPIVMDEKTFRDNSARRDFINEAKDARDKAGNPKYDGVIVKDIDVNGQKGDLFGTWLGESILTMRDTTARRLRDEQARVTAEYQNASKLAQTNGYSYSQPQYRDYANIQGADYVPAIDIGALAKETDILKYSEGVIKANGGDLKTGVTPLDEQFKAYATNRELTQAVLKDIEEADILIKKAGLLEQVMRLAVGCKDG